VTQSFVVFDLEFTAWPGSVERKWSGPGEHREVVQIGAVALGVDLAETGSLDLLVRPRINPVLSDYLIELTGITNEELTARGIDFADAFPRFLAFVAGRPLFCFGRDDFVLSENVKLYGLNLEVPVARNIGQWMRQAGIDVTGLHSCDLARAAGVPHDGRAHNALEDARSVAKAIRTLVARGAPHPLLSSRP
jgi:DNA polymerase III epsilon subunit-like protein